MLAWALLHESFSDTSLLGVAAFTASLAVAACPDEVFERMRGGDDAEGALPLPSASISLDLPVVKPDLKPDAEGALPLVGAAEKDE